MSQERDALRARWDQELTRLGMPCHTGDAAAPPRGLATRLSDVSTRVLILPPDPRETLLEFDEPFWEWWGDGRPTPFGVDPMWQHTDPTADAAIRARSSGDQWTAYLAVHRHGGVEIGADDAYEVGDQRCLRLTRAVALLWLALDRQADVLERLEIDGPWLVTLTLYRTEGALLGDLGEGWPEPGRARWDMPTCREATVAITEILDTWPGDRGSLKELALRLGGRIEDAWGQRHRRFLDRTGKQPGEFVPRNWYL